MLHITPGRASTVLGGQLLGAVQRLAGVLGDTVVQWGAVQYMTGDSTAVD